MVKELKDFDPQVRSGLQKALEGMDEILNDSASDVARVSETDFVKHLLPILTNTSGGQSLDRWLDFAGHSMRGIEVFDPSTGEALFKIPPIMRRINREFTGRGELSAFEIVRTAQKKRLVHENLGNKHLNDHLTGRVSHTAVNVSDIQQWNSILKRYGYEPIFTTNHLNEDENSVSENNSDNLTFTGEYDDF